MWLTPPPPLQKTGLLMPSLAKHEYTETVTAELWNATAPPPLLPFAEKWTSVFVCLPSQNIDRRRQLRRYGVSAFLSADCAFSSTEGSVGITSELGDRVN